MNIPHMDRRGLTGAVQLAARCSEADALNQPAFSSPPEKWQSRMAFREVFLAHVSPPAVEGFRDFGRTFYEALLQGGFLEDPETRLKDQVRAVAEDLYFSAQVLADLAAKAKRVEPTPEEHSLAKNAASWAREVFELVRAIKATAGKAGGEG